MDLPVAQEAGVFQARNQPQHARLVAVFQVILKADQVVGVGTQVFLPELHHGVRPAAGARIVQAHGLHGPKAQRVPSAAGNLFDRQAAFKVIQVFPVVALHGLGGDQGIVKAVIFFPGERAIDVVGGALAVARGHVDPAHIDGVGFHDGADGVIKEKMITAGKTRNLKRESV